MNKISLKALDKFKCIGPDCAQNCCEAGWAIEVDDETANLWKKLDTENGLHLSDNFETRVLLGKEAQYLKHTEQSRCLCFADDGYCSVQKQFGHEAIPKTCRAYPRYTATAEGFELETAVLSCPEVVRLVLMENKSSLGSVFKSTESSEFVLPVPKTGDLLEQVRYTTGTFINKVFKQSKVSSNIKLVYISKLLAIFHFEMEAQGLSPALVKNLFGGNIATELKILSSKYKKKELVPDHVTAGSFWYSTINLMLTRNNLFSELDYENLQIIEMCKQDVQQHDQFKKIYAEILKMKNKYINKYQVRFQKLLERYLRVSFINKGLPLQDKPKNLMHTLVPILVAASQLQLILWLMAMQNIEIDNDLLSKVIYQTEQYIGHSGVIENTLHNDPNMLRVDKYAEVLIDVFA